MPSKVNVRLNYSQPFDIEYVKEEDEEKESYNRLMSELMKRIMEDEEMKEKVRNILSGMMAKN